MRVVGCSSGGMGSTGEDRRNGLSSLVKQDAVGDGSGATWASEIGDQISLPGYRTCFIRLRGWVQRCNRQIHILSVHKSTSNPYSQ